MTLATQEQEVGRCKKEISRCEQYLCSGGPDVQQALLGLRDWSRELELIGEEEKRQRSA